MKNKIFFNLLFWPWHNLLGSFSPTLFSFSLGNRSHCPFPHTCGSFGPTTLSTISHFYWDIFHQLHSPEISLVLISSTQNQSSLDCLEKHDNSVCSLLIILTHSISMPPCARLMVINITRFILLDFWQKNRTVDSWSRLVLIKVILLLLYEIMWVMR